MGKSILLILSLAMSIIKMVIKTNKIEMMSNTYKLTLPNEKPGMPFSKMTSSKKYDKNKNVNGNLLFIKS